jgi:hypothetical protein
MTPALPQLDPVPLAAPVALFWFFSILTFTLHLVPMSLVLGGSLIGAVSRWKARSGDPRHAALAGLIGKLMPVLIAAAVTLGVAALLFLQVLYGRVFFSSAIVMGWLWFAVVPLLIAGYYAAYGVAFARGRGDRLGLAVVVAVIAAGIGFLYTNNMTLMLRPDAMHAFHQASARGLQLNAGDPLVLPRYLHMLLGALAIAGLGVALAGWVRRAADPAFGAWAIGYGCHWFAGATIVNLAVGTWHLAALPPAVFPLFMGQDALATLLLVGGIGTGVAALGGALLVSTTPAPGRLLGLTTLAAFVTLVQMVLVRDVVRQAVLGAAGLQPATWIAPQWGPIAVFLVLLVAAIALVGWMIAVLVRASAPAAPAETRETVGV